MELLGRGALQVELLERGRSLRGVEIDPARLCAAPRPLEHLAEALAQSQPVRRRSGEPFDREPEQVRRLVEHANEDGLLGRLLGDLDRAIDVAGAEQMSGQLLDVRVGGSLHHLREPLVVRANRVGRELRDDRLADAIVNRLHDVAPVAHAVAHEVPSLEEVDESSGRLDPCRLADRGHGQRAPSHRDDLDQS